MHTIAVVDDDRLVCKLVARALRRSGFTVFEYPSAESLLEAMGHGVEFSGVVSDVDLGKMSGIELKRELESSLPILLVSGSSAHDVDLRKPFAADELIVMVSEMIETCHG